MREPGWGAEAVKGHEVRADEVAEGDEVLVRGERGAGEEARVVVREEEGRGAGFAEVFVFRGGVGGVRGDRGGREEEGEGGGGGRGGEEGEEEEEGGGGLHWGRKCWQ